MHNVRVGKCASHLPRMLFSSFSKDFIIFCALGSASDNDIETHAPLGSLLLTLEFAVSLIQRLSWNCCCCLYVYACVCDLFFFFLSLSLQKTAREWSVYWKIMQMQLEGIQNTWKLRPEKSNTNTKENKWWSFLSRCPPNMAQPSSGPTKINDSGI